MTEKKERRRRYCGVAWENDAHFQRNDKKAMGILYAIIRIKILTASLQREKCQSGQNENASHLLDWMQRPPFDAEDDNHSRQREVQNVRNTRRVAEWQGGSIGSENHIGRRTWTLNSFAFTLSRTGVTAKNCFINQMSLVCCCFFFVVHFFHRRIIVQIEKKNGIQCISFPSALVCFASTCDASHKDRFLFQILRYVISIAPKHTSVSGAHFTEGGRKKNENKNIDGEHK